MVLKLSAGPWPFCVSLSPSVPWHARFLFRCALYIFLLLGFRQWRSRADRVFTLNMNIRLPLFWSTWSRARGPDSTACAGLGHGRDYSDCRASELKLQKCLAIVFPWIVENTWKQWPTLRVFQPSPPRLIYTEGYNLNLLQIGWCPQCFPEKDASLAIHKHHRWRVGNLELEILMPGPPGHQDQPNAQKLKTFAQLLKKQGLGSTYNRSVAGLRKLRKRANENPCFSQRNP